MGWNRRQGDKRKRQEKNKRKDKAPTKRHKAENPNAKPVPAGDRNKPDNRPVDHWESIE